VKRFSLCLTAMPSVYCMYMVCKVLLLTGQLHVVKPSSRLHRRSNGSQSKMRSSLVRFIFVFIVDCSDKKEPLPAHRAEMIIIWSTSSLWPSMLELGHVKQSHVNRLLIGRKRKEQQQTTSTAEYNIQVNALGSCIQVNRQ
jgi:hypothetical protein